MRRGAVALVLVLAAASVAGCADKQVTLRYTPPASLRPLPDARALTVFPFDDRRGTEGDNDPNRVGGVYSRTGSRTAKVMATAPFSRTLADALVAGFRARGVPARPGEASAYQPGVTKVATPFALAGEVHNFSTEARFTTSGHVSGVVRLYGSDGRLVVEKEISGRDTVGPHLLGFGSTPEKLEEGLNNALAEFVSHVVEDPAIAAALTRPGRSARPAPPGA